ncbi:YopX family protein [Bacillus velezensis]|uniref:YopX family protein n=1 Tax=Bacillus velezensis TaxID=492670 RepID=UPI0037464A51
MNTAYRVWDGGKMHYWDDKYLSLVIEGGVCWTLWRYGNKGYLVAHYADDKCAFMQGTDQFQTSGKLKRIYARDIVQQEETAPGGLYDPEPFIGEVKMIDGLWCIVNEKKGECRPLFFETATNKVIGDVYQNPELLEGAE